MENCEQVLRDFLRVCTQTRWDNTRLDAVMADVRPILTALTTGKLNLAPGMQFHQHDLARIIATATGQTVEHVALFSLSEPFPKPPWITEEAYQALWAAALYQSIQISFPDHLDRLWIDSIFKILDDETWDGLNDKLSILPCSSDFLNSLATSVADIIFDGLTSGLLWYLASLLAGREDNANNLRPLVQLLPRAVPLGIKTGGPNTWIILVA